MSTIRGSKTFSFGRDGSLMGAITEAKCGMPQVGVILWGMGIAEIRAARALAKLGFVGMQFKKNGEEGRPNPVLDNSGVSRCQEAMTTLTSKCGVEQFMLMGNCGLGSICFNTAVDDPRVIGLIMTNPHVSEVLTLSESYKHKLTNWVFWRRVLSGRADLARHLANIRWLKAFIIGRLRGADDKALIAEFTYNKDLTLPDRLDERLKALSSRGVNILIIFSQHDPSLLYFEKTFGKSFGRLRSVPTLSMEVLPTSSHVISQDDEAAGMVADIVARWAEAARFAVS